jgi:hypothetical protein
MKILNNEVHTALSLGWELYALAGWVPEHSKSYLTAHKQYLLEAEGDALNNITGDDGKTHTLFLDVSSHLHNDEGYSTCFRIYYQNQDVTEEFYQDDCRFTKEKTMSEEELNEVEDKRYIVAKDEIVFPFNLSNINNFVPTTTDLEVCKAYISTHPADGLKIYRLTEVN